MALKELYPFKSHFFTFPGQKHRLHYVDEGSGETVVMLHGNPTWSFFYRDLIRFLKPMYRCLAPDHLGCGLSDKPQKYNYCLKQHIENTMQWLKDLNIGRFHLIVHDWGGAIGMGIATRWPASVQSLTILNSGAFLSDKMPLRIGLCRIPFLGPWAIKHLNIFAKAATQMATCRSLSKPVRQGYLYPYDTPKHRVAINAFVQDIPMDPSHPSYDTLEEIQNNLWLLGKKPCLLAWGMKDFCFTPEFLEQYRKYFPDAEVEKFDDAGHYVLEDAQEEILPRIRKFLMQHPIR